VAVGGASPFATPPAVRRLALARAIATLPGRMRQVFVLHDVEGHSTEDVADLLRMAPSTVRVQLARARARLREALRASRHTWTTSSLSELTDARAVSAPPDRLDVGRPRPGCDRRGFRAASLRLYLIRIILTSGLSPG
jgi:hypothetical protein